MIRARVFDCHQNPFSFPSMSKTRLSLDITPTVKQNMDRLQERISASSYVEVFRKALALLDMITSEQENGTTFLIRDKDGKIEQLRIL